jgi:transposase
MQTQTERRIHSAEVKAAVLAECQEPGASVAAVALRHGLNANLVRKWLVGRGLKKAGLQAPRAVRPQEPAQPAGAMAGLQFVPVGLAGSAPETARAPGAEGDIHLELQRGSAQLRVSWPVSQAGACAVWLSELAAQVLK